MSHVLTIEPPRLTVADAVEAAAAIYGVAARAAHDLASERDRTFALLDANDDAVAVLKVSNHAEDPKVLDMEAAAALHVTAVDPDLRPALPWRPLAHGNAAPARLGDPPATLRAPWRAGEVVHWVRLYDALPGNSRTVAENLTDAALVAWGNTAARLGQALRDFSHTSAKRAMPWDVQFALSGRTMLDDIRDPRARDAVARVLDVFERRVAPVWSALRAQVVHADLTVDNTLTDSAGLVTGIIDFGDMGHTALVADVAAVLESVTSGREGADLLRAGRLVMDGYQNRVELDDASLQCLSVAWATRAGLTIAIGCSRAARGLGERESVERVNDRCLRMIETLEMLGWDHVARELGASR